ncbi:MAG TPA: hypothetical protein HA345_00095 [Candidatus Thalassarchaeaceae archaeon]|nr:MAG TPA: hypothetical protein D7H94_00095 [Candidatus Poseidoniales archaeon]HIH83785.1 hypothetical protein [Candidatus Thalassarchaeaceae archaeon]
MRQVILLVTVLLFSAAVPTTLATSARTLDCSDASGDGAWVLPDQDCIMFDLGSITPGDTIQFGFDSDVEVDVLMFSAAGYAVYSNDQSYRSANVWSEAGTLELLNGTADWRWTAPEDRSQTSWILIIDNLDHPQDDGQGALGGSAASGSIAYGPATIRSWTLHDTLTLLDTDEGVDLAGPFSFMEGTQVLIETFAIDGAPDVFLMTQQQRDLYLQDSSNDFRISDTEILSITTSSSRSWSVPSVHADQPLHLMVDNTASPNGGGSGAVSARVGVVLSILPVVDAVLTSTADLLKVDVGQIVNIDASGSPDDWNQIVENGYVWDTALADCATSTTGSSVDLCWTTEGVRTVEVTVDSIDGRSATNSLQVTVVDQTNPTAEILVSGIIDRGVGESFTITARSTDNGFVQKEEWFVDGLLEKSSNGSGSSFTHSFDDVSDVGPHTVTLVVHDGAGNTQEDTADIEVSDVTAPIIDNVTGPASKEYGAIATFSATASDPEDSELNFTWDFDSTVDSDGNGIPDDDVDGNGSMVEIQFTSAGSRFVICTATNDAGLSTSKSTSITILNPDAEDTGSGFPHGTLFVTLLFTIIPFVIAVGILLWRRSTNQLAARLLAERQAEEEAAASAPPPTAEEQAAMFASRSNGEDFASIAGIAQRDYSSTTSTESDSRSSPVLDDLFSDDDEVPDVETKAIDNASNSATSAEMSGVSTPNPAPSRLGIEIPDFDTDSTASPSSSSEVQSSDSLMVQATCTSCEARFKVELPSGRSSGRTACPSCGDIQTVSR